MFGYFWEGCATSVRYESNENKAHRHAQTLGAVHAADQPCRVPGAVTAHGSRGDTGTEQKPERALSSLVPTFHTGVSPGHYIQPVGLPYQGHRGQSFRGLAGQSALCNYLSHWKRK